MSEIINTINSQLHVKLIKPLGLGLLNIKKKVIKFRVSVRLGLE